MSLGLIFLFLLLLAILGAGLAWPHSRGWGCVPSGVLGLIVLVMVVTERM